VKGHLDLREGRAAGAQEDVAADVDDAESGAVALEDADAAPGLAAQVVRGPDDALVIFQIGVDLTAPVGVVAEGDRIDTRGEDLIGVLGCDAEAAGGVLAVDDDECRGPALACDRQAVEQRAAPEATHDIPDEQDPHGRLLSHTLAMAGGN
jgi:hypothetical protein